MSYVDLIASEDVKTIDDLIEYARSRYGVIINWQERAKFKKHWSDFQKSNPHVDFAIIVKAINWGKDTRRRLKTLSGVFYLVSAAFASGALPELDPDYSTRSRLEDGIFEALSIETDDFWRTRLIGSMGSAREQALTEWREHNAAVA